MTRRTTSLIIIGGGVAASVAGVLLIPRLLVLVIGIIGFEPGGGGSVHVPPVSITRGLPTPLELQLFAVNPRGPMDRRMTRITCHYRLAGSAAFIALSMVATNVDERNCVARVNLPSFPPDANGPVEYYFDFFFDGQHNPRGSPTEPVKVPLK